MGKKIQILLFLLISLISNDAHCAAAAASASSDVSGKDHTPKQWKVFDPTEVAEDFRCLGMVAAGEAAMEEGLFSTAIIKDTES